MPNFVSNAAVLRTKNDGPQDRILDTGHLLARQPEQENPRL